MCQPTAIQPAESVLGPIDLDSSAKFCVIGAGASGLAVAKNLRAAGIAFDCLEREDDVGGNWYYGKPHSRVYRSTRLISSKRETEYTDFPMPADWPEHPRHELVWQYLRSYARHFELYRDIEFNTSVARIEPAEGVGSLFRLDATTNCNAARSKTRPDPLKGWTITLSNGARRRYRGVVIANGHNWDPRWPEYPGAFTGSAIHSAQYKTPAICRGRRVLVVGGGNSGFDIAVDVAAQAAATFHSLRRAYHVLPRYLRGTPIDQCGKWAARLRLPWFVRRAMAKRGQRTAWGDSVLTTLPYPDHRLFETHPVINSGWPYAVASGTIRLKPDVRQLAGDHAVFVDGSREPIDLIIYATGYKLSFPFIENEHLNWHDGRPQLYINIFHPERDDLFVAGMIQPDSGQFGLVDFQAQLIAAYVRGLEENRPAAEQFQAEKFRGNRAAISGGIRYVSSPRHLVEVQHDNYRRRLQRCIGRLHI